MQEFEFDFNGRAVRVRAIPALQQITLVRKLAPLVATLAPVLMSAFKGDITKAIAAQDFSSVSSVIEPFAQALSDMQQDDADFIIKTALAAVLVRGDKDKWHSLVVNGQIMQDNLSAPDMLMLTIRVLKENLADFIPGLAMSLTASPAPE